MQLTNKKTMNSVTYKDKNNTAKLNTTL